MSFIYYYNYDNHMAGGTKKRNQFPPTIWESHTIFILYQVCNNILLQFYICRP